MSRKPRILLILNIVWWILGEMGKQIIRRFEKKYDFYFVPEVIFERSPETLAAFIPAVDAIHCMSESSIELFRDYNPGSLPPIATWIDHVTEWLPQHQLAVERSAAITACGKTSPVQALRSLFEILNRRSPADVMRGLAMLRGRSYKAAPSDRNAVKANSNQPIPAPMTLYPSGMPQSSKRGE